MEPESSIDMISAPTQQDSLFKSLIALTEYSIPESLYHDSLSFLILPVQASCPSCRKKTIDSIMQHATNLTSKQFIIISAMGGRKTINSYFQEQDYELPVIKNNLFLDSNNLAFKHDLYKIKPTIYYTYSAKAYKKVSAIPSTVREDLREFFSGYRKSSK